MVKKKNKIVVEPFDDIKIIGINTHIEDYQLAWHINNVLKINLVKYEDIMNGEEQLYSYYLYDGGENANAFNLVALSNGESRWIKFTPPTDYLIIIRNFITDNNYQKLISKIKQIPDVVLAYNVDIEQNKKIDALLEDIEMHEIYLQKVKS